MISRCVRLLFLVALASFALLASAQDWPDPATTPKTEVLCNTNQCALNDLTGKKTVGYDAPITRFVGRFIDSSGEKVDFNYIQVARARGEMRIATDRNRIYAMIGSSVAAWDIDSFFTRLESGEALSQPNRLPLKTRAPNSRNDSFLNFDRFFYSKNGTTGKQFPETNAGDGEHKLFDYDWDDRGNIYVACGPYSWGIAKDDGGLQGTGDQRMDIIYQLTSALKNKDDVSGPNKIISFKSGTQYYVVVSASPDDADVNIWNVTNASAPTRHRTGPMANNSRIGHHVYSSDRSRIGILTYQGAIEIYSPEGLASLNSPLARFSDREYYSITSDGTNFYGTSKDNSTGVVTLSILSPSGNSYQETAHTLNVKSPAGKGVVNYGAGYLTLTTYERERGLNGSGNVWLLKLNGLAKPNESGIDSWTGQANTDYFARYYMAAAASTGHVAPGTYTKIESARVHKKGSKYYLILEAYGIADVYEIRGSDTIGALLKKKGKTANEFSKQAANSGPYYGDALTFTSTFSGGVHPSVTWDFGDGAVQTATGTSPDIEHQYGGLIASDLPKTRTVKATNAGDTAMNDTIQVTLAKPQVRVGVFGTTTLFTSATTDYTLPIVTSDQFVDASDGALEGHYSDWKLDSNVSALQVPNQKYSVGPVGKRSLVFKGHYGPYTTSGSTITPGSAEALFSIDSIKYEVRPFAAAMLGPLSCQGSNCTTTINSNADGVGFRSATRFTTLVADLLDAGNAMVNYKWELLKPGTGGLVSAGQSKEGQSKISAVPDFVVPRSAFVNAVDWKARLTLTLVNLAAVTDPLYATATVDSVPLLGPTPNKIEVAGCENAGAPCALTVSSTRQDVDPKSWTYAWSVTAGPVSVAGSSQSEYEPKFTQAGSYIVKVTVKNALGDANLEKSFNVLAPICSSAPTDQTTTIYWSGPTSKCTPLSNCAVNEAVQFAFQPFQWTPADCDKYEWDFGDQSAKSTQKEPTHTYSSTGTYTVKLKIDGGLSDANVSRTITIGQVTNPDDGNGNNGNSCPTMSAGANVYWTAEGSPSNCGSAPSAPPCTTSDTITFSAKFYQYPSNCASHTYLWTFGDGSQSSGQIVQKKYANGGSYSVNLRVSNGKQTINVPNTLTVQGEAPASCPTMTGGGNVYMGWTGATSQCTTSSPNCNKGEVVNFRVNSFQYPLECATHSYEWDFGDGTAKSTQKEPSHTYANTGTYKVSLKITRGGSSPQTVVHELNLTIGVPGPACPAMHANFNVFTTFFGEKSFCTTSSGDCEEEETVTFNVNTYQYTFTCAPHTFTWDFGDGTTGVTGQSPTHKYTRPGIFTVKVKVKNDAEEVTLTDVVTVHANGPTRRRGVRK